MAKHDSARAQNQINNQGTTMQDSQNALMNQLQGQNQGFGNLANYGAATSLQDYNQNQNNYNSLFNALGNGQVGVGIGSQIPQQRGGSLPQISSATNDPNQISQWLQAQASQPGADPILQTPDGIKYYTTQIINSGGLTPDNTNYWQNKSTLAQYGGAVGAGGGSGLNGALGSAQSGFQNFADTGGLSDQDKQDLRNRATSAMRSTYQNAQTNLNQNKMLQQFSPNYAAATAKLTRDLGYGLSDAATNANASIAQMVQSGKLSGLQGLTGVAGQNSLNQQNNIQDMLQTLGGSSSLYGSSPGLANTFGNQYLNASNQLLGGQQSQNQIGLGLISGQNNKGQIPGDFAQAVGNFGGVAKGVGDIGAGLSGFNGTFGGK